MRVRTMPGTVPRNGLPWKPYEYHGTGTDTLTPPDYAALLDEIERQETERQHAVMTWASAARAGRVPLQPCGTTAAYQRHMRRHEEPCWPCREAHSHAQRERRRGAA